MNRKRLAFGVVLFVLAVLSSGCALLVAGAVGGATGAAASAHEAQGEEEHSAGAYIGAVAADVIYVPVKVVFAALGMVTAGMTYIVTAGNTEASSAVWDATARGTYVITPRHIEGKEPVHFIGSAET
jgi:hypothetical protein